MIVLGIDPGTATTGYGVIKTNGNSSLEVIASGLIETAKGSLIEKRLNSIYERMLELLNAHKPDVLVIEKVFFASNAKTAISIGQAQGVIMLAGAKSGLELAEYAPGTIKKIVAGNGRADKKEMQRSVRKFLGAKIRSKAKKRTHFDNEADALAIAICHIHHKGVI